MAEIIIYTDGGARGNPGPAALGAYIIGYNKQVLAKIARYLGETTNNVAEYSAIIEALDWCIVHQQEQQIETIRFYMDSQLAWAQLSGLYKIKNDKIREMVFKIRGQEAQLKIPVFYNHIPREKNKQADSLVNLALDKAQNKI